MAVNQVREQQIVDMAAVAWHIDDSVAWRDVRQRFEVVCLDAVVDMFPEPAQEQFHGTHRAIGIVGSDLEREFLCPAARHVTGNAEARGLGGNCRAHRLAGQQDLDLGIAMRKVRTDGHLPLPTEVHAQHARHLALGRRDVERGGPAMDQFAQRQWPVEAHQRLPSVQQHRKKLAQPARRAPCLGEQRLEDGLLLVGAATPEHNHRHQLHIECRFGHHRPQLIDQQAGRSRHGTLVTPVEEEQRALRPDAAERERCLGRRQTGAPGFFEKDQQVRQMAVLQDVADRSCRIDVRGRLGEYRRAHPGIEQALRQWNEPAGNVEQGPHHLSCKHRVRPAERDSNGNSGRETGGAWMPAGSLASIRRVIPGAMVGKSSEPWQGSETCDRGNVERAMRIELTAQAWEAWVLPLYDARSWAGGCILSAAAVLFNPRSTRDTVPRGTEAAPFRTPR